MKNQKIIIISESIDVNDGSSCTKCNVGLIENLKECGFEVTVFHYTRKNIILSGIDCYEIKEKKLNLVYLLSRIQRILSRRFNIHLNKFLENIFGFSFTFFNDVNSIKSIISKVVGLKPDLVVTLSKGTSFRPHYALLSFPILHQKWLANIHDPFPFHFNPRPYNWVEPGYKKKELFFSSLSEKAQYSSFPSKLLKEWMGSYFPNFLNTGIILPHQNSDYNLQNNELPNYFESSKFNLLHAGNLLKQRSPVGLIEGFLLFLKKNPLAITNSKLILIGPADFHNEILTEYSKNNSELYIHNGYVPFDLVYNLQKNVSVNIILESKAEISPFLPGKFPHCIEANKIILSLSPFYSETKRLLGVNYEYWSEVDDVPKIASLIGRLYDQWLIDPQNILLNRPDLLDYLSPNNLKATIETIV
jgi:hypothetical protein